MENSNTIEIGIPDKSCGVTRCSDCSSLFCRKVISAKKIEVKKSIQEISLDTLEDFSTKPVGMHDLFANV